MDSQSQPVYTQAIPQPETPSSTQAASFQDQQPVASTSTATTNGSAQPNQSASTSSVPAPAAFDSKESRFHPFPEQLPQQPPLTGFASIASRAAEREGAQPYTKPPPYVPPEVTLGAGLSSDPPIRRIVGDGEAGEVLEEPGVVLEEEVQKLSVTELRKMGLGRAPSGVFLRFLLPTSRLLGIPLSRKLTLSTRTGYCYSSRMTLHAPLPNHDPNDPHPEQPARIVGVYNKLTSKCLPLSLFLPSH
jgi:histone deacetylase 6